jgi:hypothetical protein
MVGTRQVWEINDMHARIARISCNEAEYRITPIHDS